jgi:uncharacterized membrane protein YphA (DoxX/SURF4 family)
MIKKTAYNVARFVAAIIMVQTLYFKFTASAESVYIFEMVGMEPWGRWFVGIMELIAAILLIVPKTSWAGGVLTVGLMAGAIGLHLTVLGIEVMNDDGTLFKLAFATFICGIYVVVANKDKIFNQIIPKLLNRK